MNRIKKDDTVVVIGGRDRGKAGRVMRVFPGQGQALVEGVNYVKKHQRARSAEQPGGIVQMEVPIYLDKLMPRCPHCNKPTRVRAQAAKDGSKARTCQKCGASF